MMFPQGNIILYIHETVSQCHLLQSEDVRCVFACVSTVSVYKQPANVCICVK